MVMEHMWNIHHCSILILIYTLLLPEGKREKPGNLPQSSGTLNRKVLSLFSVLNGQNHLVTEGAPRRFIRGQTYMWSCTADGKGSDT